MSHRHFSRKLTGSLMLLLALPTLSVQAAPQAPATLNGLYPSDRQAAAVEGGFRVDPMTRETMRLFYNSVYRSSVEVDANWNGDVASCNAGGTSKDYQAALQRRINWFRAMAGVPANITFDSEFNAKAQQAALMMVANKALSHTPAASWTCYTTAGAEAAGKSTLFLGNSGFDAIDGYIGEPGANNYFVGHRRWLLYPQTQVMGTGDVAPLSGGHRANAIWVFDNHLRDARPVVRDDFVAWPPKGHVPYQTVSPRWSLSYPAADFSAATITMTRNGTAIGVTKEAVVNGPGENTLVWIPAPYTEQQNWLKPVADESYQVTVSNVLIGGQVRTFSYPVTIFDPAVKGADHIPQLVTGGSQMAVGQKMTYAFTGINGADAYQWRQGSAAPYATTNGAEGGLGDFVAKLSAGYSAVSTGRRVAGQGAYHLAHAQPTDQMLTLNKTLLVGPAGSLQFYSYLGYASAHQAAIVELSEDDGQSWTVLYQQAGTEQPESGYSLKVVSLASWADKTISLRFRYQLSGNWYYPQTEDNAGWSFDEVKLTDVQAATFTAPKATETASTFTVTATTAGSYLLQVRPLLFGGFAGEWSAVKTVSAGGSAQPFSNFQTTAAIPMSTTAGVAPGSQWAAKTAP